MVPLKSTASERATQKPRLVFRRGLTQVQRNRINRLKTAATRDFSGFFSVYVDIEYVKKHLPKNFNIQTLRDRFRAFLKVRYPNCELCDDKITVVGDMSRLFGRKSPRSTPWTGVKKYDVYPRETTCKVCQRPIQKANLGFRPPANFERKAELVLFYTQEFPCNIVLVVGDGDYRRLIAILQSWGINVFLVMAERGNKDLPRATGSARSFSLLEVLST